MPRCLEAVQTFFANIRANNPDMLARWTRDMETQINVSGDGGEPVADKRNVWTDGINEWFNIRIPRDANSEPHFRDFDMSYSVAERAESIGCTGWDWVARRSRWVGFDFDTITGHAAGVGVSDAELQRIRGAVQDVPWVEVRRSTGGSGLHLYVYLDRETANHGEHAALARAVLHKLSQRVDFDLTADVDACGGNMWIWSRRATVENGGLSLIKAASEPLTDIPAVSAPTVRPDMPAGTVAVLDETHNALIRWLCENGYAADWQAEHGFLQTHTHGLAAAAEALGYVGVFRTVSPGTEPGKANCFAFPYAGGWWKVYRLGKASDGPTWTVTENGWTTCELNRLDVDAVVAATGGNPLPGGWFAYRPLRDAMELLQAIDCRDEFSGDILTRGLRLKREENGISLRIERKDDDRQDDLPGGWERISQPEKAWQKFVGVESPETDPLAELDTAYRYVVDTDNAKVGWFHCDARGQWGEREKSDIKDLLAAAMKTADAKRAVGYLLSNPWTQDGAPFGDEYPSPRTWNRVGAQLAFPVVQGEHPTWAEIFRHNGQGLDEYVQQNDWCRENGIRAGADYLMLWAAIMFQRPASRLPYLAFVGAQNVGKSTWWKTLKLLLKSGFAAGKIALGNQQGFNGELEGAVLVVVEETDVSSGLAQGRMKDWVANDGLSIHPKRGQVRETVNYAHWVQTCNDIAEAPISGGDTRVVAIEQRPLERRLDWDTVLKPALEAEAPAFLWTMFNLELPPPVDRFWLPALDTDAKQDAIREQVGFDREALKYSLYALVGMREMLGLGVWQGQPKELHDWLLYKPETVEALGAALKTLESELADLGVMIKRGASRGKRVRRIGPTEGYWQYWTPGELQAEGELRLPHSPAWTLGELRELLTILQAC